MAGDWIKIRKDLPGDPAVLQMASDLGMSRQEVVGWLIDFWSWVDSQFRCNHAVITCNQLRLLMGRSDVVDALKKVGWLVEENGGITIPNFERHLSKSAKRRALVREAVKRFRNQNVIPKKSPDVYQRREEMMDDGSSSSLVSKSLGSSDVFINNQERESGTRAEKIDWNQNLETWNSKVAPILGAPKIHGLKKDRRLKLLARLRDDPLFWEHILAEAPKATFAHGSSWISFDWLMRPANVQKFLEGNYRQGAQKNEKAAIREILAKQLQEEESNKDVDATKLEQPF